MDKDEERVNRFYPKCFENFKMPECAKEEEITVYRACKTGKCDCISFTPSYKERNLDEESDLSNPGLYSLSTYEKPMHVKRFAKLTSEYNKPYTIAIGRTEPSCGEVQRTRERVVSKKNTSHVDWWLYENAKPHKYFDMIDDIEKHIEEYKRVNKF